MVRRYCLIYRSNPASFFRSSVTHFFQKVIHYFRKVIHFVPEVSHSSGL